MLLLSPTSKALGAEGVAFLLFGLLCPPMSSSAKAEQDREGVRSDMMGDKIGYWRAYEGASVRLQELCTAAFEMLAEHPDEYLLTFSVHAAARNYSCSTLWPVVISTMTAAAAAAAVTAFGSA